MTHKIADAAISRTFDAEPAAIAEDSGRPDKPVTRPLGTGNTPERHFQEAADEIARLRGELVLWKASALLAPSERQVLEQAIEDAKLVGTESQANRLRWLLERLTCEVPNE
jgi:hypothetical protein